MYSTSIYSDKFRGQQKENYDQYTEDRRHQTIIHDKARRFSMENARRRRALELKKKIEAQKESKRRQEALDERRKRQHEATVKYQRFNRVASATDRSRPPGLEEALNAVRLSSAPIYRTKYQANYSQSDTVHVYSPWKATVPRNVYNTASYRAQHEQLQTSSSKNLSQSRSLFEQQLQDQQRQFALQHQKSLQDFNRAIINESKLSNHKEDEVRDSLCSVDSLEEGNNAKEKVQEPERVRETNSETNNQQIYNANYTTSGNPATLHSTVNKNGSTTQIGNKLFVPKSVTTSELAIGQEPRNSNLSTENTKIEQKPSSDLRLEETTDTDIVDDKVDFSKADEVMVTTGPTYTSAASKIGSNQTWTQSGSMYTGTDSSVSRPTRSYSARTTATGVTVTPAAYNWNEYKSYVNPVPAPRTADSIIRPQVNDYPNSHAPATSTTTSTGVYFVNETPSKPVQTSNVNNVKIYKEPKKEVDYVDEVEEDDSSDDVLQDSSHDTAPKSILKKIPSNYGSGRYGSSIYLQRSGSNISLEGVKLRDSIDVTKSRQSETFESTKKKSVRWTDWDKQSKLTIQLGTPRDEPTGKRRPFSATTPLTVSSVPKSTKAKRSASAGTIRHAPVPKPRAGPKVQPALVATRNNIPSNNNGSNYATMNGYSHTYPAPSHQDSDSPCEHATHNGERTRSYTGIGLDKTPTDDEINWLWDKVRTCLHSREGNNSSMASQRPTDIPQNRTAANVQKQTFDGRQLVANLRNPTTAVNGNADQATPLREGNIQRKVHKPSSSQTGNSYIRLLQLRRQNAQKANKILRHGVDAKTTAEYGSLQPYATIDNVSESLQLFQTAEKLSQHPDLSETEIAKALTRQQQAGVQTVSIPPHTRKAPSALSLEEQRIMQSLDRLNERLRIVTDGTLQSSPSSVLTTKPASYSMRGHSATRDSSIGRATAASARRQAINRNIRRVNYRH
ncbi:uncharacterized protein LOC102809896 [Saccoglossus kowalevskii]|uniref:Uncharacterized protein LOC102809896 n=1 Tax=Saccoglossus kowalevskii TaxID=10224 RepID=A0ABM0M0U3_SACKO|nr:PREDICTED: uncharacterized protein LOC102809896 [Saccoglossus kowalevskii]